MFTVQKMLVGFFIVSLWYFFFKFFFSNFKIIYISHSIESEIREKYSNKFIYLLTKLLEKLVFQFSDLSTSVSKKERDKINSLYKVKTILLPNGIQLYKFKKQKKINGDYIIYTGSYLYKPNKDAIDYLNTCIMPKLIKKMPNLNLVLTGGGFKKKYPWVIDKGIVSKSDLYNFLFFQMFMCSIKIWIWDRIKIIEALSLGTIVISSKKE